MSYIQAVKFLPKRYRRILLLRKKGKTFAEIGRRIGTSRQRAWELWKRASSRVGLEASMRPSEKKA
jgi:transcriptional regulator